MMRFTGHFCLWFALAIGIAVSAVLATTSRGTADGSHLAFLPIVYKVDPPPPPTATATPTGTSTPTATPAPPPTATPCSTSQQLLANHSFEYGFSPWLTSGNPVRSTTYATDGAFSVRLGGANNLYQHAVQWVNVPLWAERAAIWAHWFMLSTDSTVLAYDGLQVGLFDADGNLISGKMITNIDVRRSWQELRVPIDNLDLYRGKTVGVAVRGITDGSYATTWYVDNVLLVVACGASAAATAMEGGPAPSHGEAWRERLPAIRYQDGH